MWTAKAEEGREGGREGGEEEEEEEERLLFLRMKVFWSWR